MSLGVPRLGHTCKSISPGVQEDPFHSLWLLLVSAVLFLYLVRTCCHLKNVLMLLDKNFNFNFIARPKLWKTSILREMREVKRSHAARSCNPFPRPKLDNVLGELRFKFFASFPGLISSFDISAENWKPVKICLLGNKNLMLIWVLEDEIMQNKTKEKLTPVTGVVEIKLFSVGTELLAIK